jgi:carbonic anhydrase/acetyltransferase-like protein (isoleucine patch superfamily)
MSYIENGNSAKLYSYKGVRPNIHPSAFLCDGVKIIGDVEIGENCSVWFNTVIRGDVHFIKIGNNTNIQDMSMLHVTNGKYSLNIGNNVSIAHSVTLHGSTIKDNVLIGIGAKVLDNSVVNSFSLVAAGSLVRENFVVPEGVLVAGVPAKIVRDLNEREIEMIKQTPINYINYSKEFRNSIKAID